MHVKKGDMVVVISGEEKGKMGKILKAIPKQNRVIVEGVNMVKKHQRPSEKVKTGGIIETEAPIHVSNVMLVCPKCGKPTRTGRKFVGEGDNRKKVRYCKKCGEIVDEV